MAANPPDINRIYEAPGPVWGGLTGDGNNLYFATLARNIGGGTTYSKVISLTANGTVRWTWNHDCPGAAGNMRMVPALTYGPVVWPNGFAGGTGGYLPLPPGYSGGEARDINNEGHILGSDTQNGAARQWLLYPVPQE